jgi:ubiquinone/menaquinone biosynthesis C-methylase UbiE
VGHGSGSTLSEGCRITELANQLDLAWLGPTEEALPALFDNSYDFVFALSSLRFVADIEASLAHHRIARRSILLSLDDLSDDYIRDFTVTVYNHAKVEVPEAKEDYLIRG